jgi:probable F420-dependent oxidoreductase
LSTVEQGSLIWSRSLAGRVSIGVDVMLLPDHLEMTAPLVSLVAIADAVPSIQVGNLVLNAGFYRPALLARDLASVDSATGGRLIIGLGTGYAEEEFRAAGIPFPTAGQRVQMLADHVIEIKRLLTQPDYLPRPAQTPPPIMVAGKGDKVLTLAAQHADIAGIAGVSNDAELADRVQFIKDRAADRIAEIELQFTFATVRLDPHEAPTVGQTTGPAALTGPASAAADHIRALHRQHGISHFSLNGLDGIAWSSLEKVIAAVK